MKNGVFINMKNPDALVTVAMLSAFLKKENKEYLDIITPFILRLLPKKQGEKVDKSKIMQDLCSEYGFEDMPMNVLVLILSRLSRYKVGILHKENGEYYVKKVFDSTEFDNKRLRMKELIESVLDSLIKFFDSNTSYKSITREEAKNRFILFLNYYGYSIIKDIDELKSITIHTDVNNYHVARFILDEYKNDTAVFHSILEIIKGFLVYKSIYFFSTQQKIAINSKLKGTVVYFDTRLLIYALGYNREEDKLATRELIRLIKENGGEVKTFSHIKDEVAGILTKFAKDKDSRNSLSLDYLNTNNYDEVDVIRLRDALTTNLKVIGIEVVDVPEYGCVQEHDVKDKGFLDLQELKDRLNENFRKIGKFPKDTSIENDIDSISAISRIRGKSRSCSVEDCKAIFATTNLIILKTLHELYHERFYRGEICFAITDVDLTSILWLKSFDKPTNLPCLKLLENAYAACCPSPEVMNSFVEKVNQLEKEGKVSVEEALLMRSQHSIKQDIVELSENNPDKITPDLIIKVKERLVNDLTKESQVKIDALTKENREYKDRKNQAYERAESEARLKSSNLEKILIMTAKFIFGIIGLIAILVLIYTNVISDYKLIPISIILIVISVLGFIDTIKNKYGVVLKYITIIKERYFNKIYAQKVEELKIYFP